MSRELVNKHMVEQHNQQVKKYWQMQAIRDAEEARRRQREQQNVLNLYERATNPGLDLNEAARNLEINQARQAEEAARAQGRQYMESQQHRQNRQMAQQMADQMAANTGMDAGFFLSRNQDPTEKEYDAVANYYRNQRENLEAERITSANLEELGKWSKEEQNALMYYAINRFNTEMAPEGILVGAQAYQNLIPLMDKYGQKRVLEIAESFTRNQNATHAEDLRQRGTQWANSGFWGAAANSVATVAANAIGTISSPLGYLQEMATRTGQYRTLDPNNMGNLPNVYSGAVRGTVAENISEGNGVLGKAGAVLYQGTMGALDNLARIAMGGGTKFGTLGLAAMGSFGSTLSEASAQGATPGQAVGKAVLSAGIEIATEKIGLDELFAAGKGGYQGAKAAFKQALKQAGIEATEEEISLLGNVLVDALVMRENSEYNQTVGELVANGVSYRDARAQADRQLWDEAVNTALTSFVSGGVMSGAQSGGQYVGQQFAERQQMRSELSGDIRAMMAREAGTDDNTEAVGAENAPTEKPAEYTNEQIREAMNELYPREQTGQEISETADTNAISNPVESYPAEKQKSIRSYLQAVDSNIKSFVERVKSGDMTFKRQKISDVSQRAAGDIGKILGIDASGYTHNINTNGIQHILNRHGENGEHDNTMAQDADISRVGWVLENYDSVELLLENGEQVYSSEFRDKNDRPAPQIRFVKKIGGSYYVVEAACENRYKKLWVQSAYLQKNGDVTQTPAEDPSANHETNARSAFASPSPDYRVTENGRNVNGQNAPQWAETGGFGDDAGNALYKSLGAAGQKFRHEVRRSKVYGNTYKNATDPEVRTAGEKALELDPKIAEYDYISEEESVSNARDRVNAPDGLETELEYLTSKQGWTGEDNDTAMMILKQLQKDGDVAAFKALARAQREQGTSGGQFIQSFAKYSRDATRAAVDAVEMLDKLGKGDVPKKFWKKNGSFNAWKDDILKSTMEIANDIEAVEDGDAEAMRNIVRQLANFRKTTAFFGMSSDLTKNAERILRKMDFNTAKDIACAQLAKIPDDFRSRSKGEVIKAIRYQNMLSSLVTVGRNLVGNGTMGMVDAFSDATAGRFADLLLSKATGKRTVGNDIRYAKEYLNAARDAADMASLLAELDIPAEHEGKYTGRTRTFSPQGGMLSRFFSAYEKYMNYALQVSDEFFSGGTAGAVSKSLEALGAKSGLTNEEIAALGDRAGRRRTFKEGRRLARASGKMKDALNTLGTEDFGAGDMLLAFAETPAEMGQVAIDYSGTGILEGFAEMASIIKDARNGKSIDVERQRKAVSDFGRGVTGVGMIALFTALAAKGLIAVHDDEDKDKRGLEQSLGLSGAQFNIDATIRALRNESAEWQDGDLVMSIDFLQPFNSQMYIGYLLSQEEEVGLKEYAGASVRGIAQSVLDIPMMGTIEDIADLLTSFGEVSEGDYSAVTDAAGQLIGNQASSFIPAWMRQTAQYMDPVYRDTTGENPLDAAKNRVMSSIPGLSQKLPAKYDGLGNLQTRYDNKLLGFFNTFLNPGALKRIQTSDIADKLDELGDKSVYPEYLAPKSFQVDGETVMVSGKEMTETYQKTYGDNVAALYGGLMDNEDFQKLNKEQQIEALKQAKTYATQFAKAAVSDYGDIPEGTSSELVQDIIRKVAAAEMTDAFTAITKAWREGYEDDSGALEALENAAAVYDALTPEMQEIIKENSSGRVGAFIEARAAGMDAQTFGRLYRTYWDIDQREGMTATRRANAWAAELREAMEERRITKRQHDLLRESLVFRSSQEAEATRFDGFVEQGIDTDDAAQLAELLYSITGTGSYDPETGRNTVRDVDRMQAVAGASYLTPDERFDAMRAFMNDGQAQKMETVRDEFHVSASQYAAIYRAYLPQDTKAEEIDAYMKLGYTKQEAERLYRIYHPTK